MSNLSHVQRKIKTVSVTKRVTHALKVISTTQQHVYRELKTDSLPYFQGIYNIFFELFNDPEHDIKETNKRLFSFESGKKELWLVLGSDIGMCGDMNERLARYLLRAFNKDGDGLILLGNRLSNYIDIPLGEFILFRDKSEVGVRDAAPSIKRISKKIFDLFMDGNYQKLSLLYVKDPKEGLLDKINILPFKEDYFDTKRAVFVRNWNTKVKYPDAIIDIFPQYLECVILSALMSSKLGEHTIRREMMHNATKNAEELLDEYTLLYNKIRQANITQEITEIVVAAKFKDKK